MRSLATQLSLGYKADADIDQATEFTYKVDRKIFQTMITNMDWIEESEIRKFQVALRADRTHRNQDKFHKRPQSWVCSHLEFSYL